MSYRFEAGRIYRMPTHFGPAPGPRQMPGGVVGDRTRSPRRLSFAASFLTDGTLLERHLPEGFSLAGEPVVTIEFHYVTEIVWLAVIVAVGQNGDSAWIEVRDDGAVFDPTTAEQLVTPFAKGEGSGLGLPIAAQVARAHGGSLNFARCDGLTTVRLSIRRDAV